VTTSLLKTTCNDQFKCIALNKPLSQFSEGDSLLLCMVVVRVIVKRDGRTHVLR